MSGLAANVAAENEPTVDKIRSRSVISSNQNQFKNQPISNSQQVSLNVDSFSSQDSYFQFRDALNILPLLFADQRSKRPLFAASFNLFLVVFLTYITESTHSLGFRCLVFLAIFDFSSLVTCLVSIWVSRQPTSSMFSFGFSRCEVLSVFSSSMLAMLGCFIVFKESVEHILMPHNEDLEPRLIFVATGICLGYHLLVTYAVKNPAMSHVIKTAPSSWLQEHVADVSRAICAIIPGLDKLLLPRINSVALVGISCAVLLWGSTFLVTLTSYVILDTISAALISFMMFATMLPLSIYSGKILVQTTPSHVVGQLEKTLREVSTLDGVLEFRNEHFWTIGFNNLCGSVQIRVRRDANEQMVLAHVLSRLSSSASNVTVQIFKDDWTQLSAATKFYYNKSCSEHNHSKESNHSHSHSGPNGHSHDHGGHPHSHSHDSQHSRVVNETPLIIGQHSDHVNQSFKPSYAADSQVPRRFNNHQQYFNSPGSASSSPSQNAGPNPMKMI